MRGYEELRSAAAWVDLSGRGRIRARGEDRKRLLHAMTTNHVEQLEPGQGLYAFFLNAQGRVLADAVVLCREDDLLLDVEPEAREKVRAHLDRFIIMDDVTLEDLTGPLACVGVEGPEAAARLAALGAALPEADFHFTAWDGRLVVRAAASGGPGWRLILPAGQKPALVDALALPAADDAAVRTVRIENGLPRYGEELGENLIAQETNQTRALHFSKGCYLGQEIVERVRSRGALHKMLMAIRIEGTEVPARETEITAEGQKGGVVFSAAYSPAEKAVRGLALMRLDFVRAGKPLRIGERAVQVVEAPFTPNVAAPACA